MATSTDTHISRVILDTKEAKDRLNDLENKLKELKRQETKHTLKVSRLRLWKDK